MNLSRHGIVPSMLLILTGLNQRCYWRLSSIGPLATVSWRTVCVVAGAFAELFCSSYSLIFLNM